MRLLADSKMTITMWSHGENNHGLSLSTNHKLPPSVTSAARPHPLLVSPYRTDVVIFGRASHRPPLRN
jgi:hypothetical protein